MGPYNGRGGASYFVVSSPTKQQRLLLPAWAFEEEEEGGGCSGSGSGGSGARASAASAASAAMAAAAAGTAQAYLLIFATAFLSSLLGFNTGVSLAVQGRLRHPDSDILGMCVCVLLL
jgi:hypothetical protein